MGAGTLFYSRELRNMSAQWRAVLGFGLATAMVVGTASGAPQVLLEKGVDEYAIAPLAAVTAEPDDIDRLASSGVDKPFEAVANAPVSAPVPSLVRAGVALLGIVVASRTWRRIKRH